MKKLEIRDSFIVEENFPKVPYVIRGEAGKEHFKWSDELIQDWNSGDVDAHEFISRRGGIISAVTDGNKLGLESSESITFELNQGVFCSPHPKLKAVVQGCLAARGPWYTAPHIEWGGGGESLAAVLSGSKLWLFAYTPRRAQEFYGIKSFDDLFQLLTVDSNARAKKRKGHYLTEHLSYHLGTAGDRIIQPAFAVHAVVTEGVIGQAGQFIWSLVSGYEGTDPTISSRGRDVFNHYVLDIGRETFVKELRFHKHNYLTRLLKIRDYREADKRCSAAEGSNLLDYYDASNVTVHCKMLFRAGFELDRSFSLPPKGPARKKRKLLNLQGSSSGSHQEVSSSEVSFQSTLSDITDSELARWSKIGDIVYDIDETAPRKKSGRAK